MPKPKKEDKNKKAVGGHKGAAKEEKLDEPSRVGSSRNSDSDRQAEKDAGTARYASITGATTPPPQEITEKA